MSISSDNQSTHPADDATSRGGGCAAPPVGLERELLAIEECNRALVHATSAALLFHDVCRICVEVGGYRMAWVGRALEDEDKTVSVMATAGPADAYLDGARITWADDEFGRGPAGSAIRLGQPAIARHIEDDPSFAPWRDRALAAGYASSIALPLRLGTQQSSGALMIYSTAPDAFDDREVELLVQLADDLSFGYEAIQRRNQAAQYQAFVRQTRDIVLLVDADTGAIIEANEAAVEVYGYSPSELLEMTIFDLRSLDARPAVSAQMQTAITTGVRFAAEHRRADGSVFPVEVMSSGGTFDGRNVLFSIVRDMSESRRVTAQLEAAVAHSERIARDVVDLIGRIIEARDPYTRGHQIGVSRLAGEIGRRLGMDRAAVDGLMTAGLVHDIGKLTVPVEILNKFGPLQEYESDIIRHHADAGYSLLKEVDFPWAIASIVWEHHERLDGSGYPRGLEGDAISLEARVLAVADTVEAMTAHRPYRPQLGIDAAVAELRAHPERYDARVVAVCLDLLAEGLLESILRDPR